MVMNKRFRTCSLDQPFLLPPSLQDWLPPHHLARFIAEVVDELDLGVICADYDRKDGRGLAAYHPVMLTRVLLYAYCVGVTSSRRIEKATYEDLAVRYLAADQHPDHDTIAAFRQEHLKELGALFVQALRMCQRAGLVKLGNVALDGTKIQASASRQCSVSYARLTEQEEALRDMVERLLGQAGETDREEDEAYGKGRSGEELPPELADAEKRLKKIREAKRALAQEAAQALEEARRNHADVRPRGRPRKGEEVRVSRAEHDKRKNRFKRAQRNAEHPTRQFNFTDPDSRVMRDNGLGCFVQGYNAQIAVDDEAQVIVAADVSQSVVDRGQLLPMCARMRETLGSLPPVITADAGYWDSTSIEDPSLRGVEVLVAPDALHQWARPKPFKPNPAIERMRRKLSSGAARCLYAMRRTIVEPVFGQIKEARRFRRIGFRGLEKVQAEWKLICLTHNLLKLFRGAWQPQAS
jgi:transposase